MMVKKTGGKYNAFDKNRENINRNHDRKDSQLTGITYMVK
jgi:hypothetical protein